MNAIANNRDTARSQNIAYDTLNCIAAAKTASTTGPNCWGLRFGIDIWDSLQSMSAASGYSQCTFAAP